MRKRIFSRLTAMLMAAALLSTTALATVEINQDYVDELNKSVVTRRDDHQYVSVPLGDEGDNEYKLVEDVKTEYTLRFANNATLDLAGYTIDHQGKEGSVIEVGNVENPSDTTLTIKDSSKEGTGTITGGNVASGYNFGGGIQLNGSTVILEGGNITGNKAYKGGGVGSGGNGNLIMRGGSITDNEAQNYGAVYLECGGRAEITGGVISRNIATKQDQWSDALYNGIGTYYSSFDGDAAICDNGAGGIKHVYLPATCTQPSKCKGCGQVLEGSVALDHNVVPDEAVPATCISTGLTAGSHCTRCDDMTVAQTATDMLPHSYTSEVTTAPDYGVPGVRTYTCSACGDWYTEAIPALVAVVFGEQTTGDGTGTNIANDLIPLAGIVTEAQLLDALYQHEGSPEVEIVEKYAAHEYAAAISWALANGIVTDEFDPDEVVTVAILRDVLTAYVEYKEIDFTVTVDGEDDEIVMDLGERLTVFFAELEK